MKKKMETYIAISSLVISVLALGFSISANYSANRQFIVLNQSYIEFEPKVEIVTDQNSEGLTDFVDIDDSDSVTTLMFKCTLTNVGNLPLKYVVQKCDATDGRPVKSIKNGKIYGIIYPKQSRTFNAPFLDYSPTALTFADVRSYIYQFNVKIDYWDLHDDDHVKTIERVYLLFINNSGVSIQYDKILDKL